MKSLNLYSPGTMQRKHSTLSPGRKKEPKPKQNPGSVNGRYPVVLNDGRTIIYINDPAKEKEIRERYAS
jgi:hypothetical protein